MTDLKWATKTCLRDKPQPQNGQTHRQTDSVWKAGQGQQPLCQPSSPLGPASLCPAGPFVTASNNEEGGVEREIESLSVTRGKSGLFASASHTPMVHWGTEVSTDNRSLGCKLMNCTSFYKDPNRVNCRLVFYYKYSCNSKAANYTPRLPAIPRPAHMVGEQPPAHKAGSG